MIRYGVNFNTMKVYQQFTRCNSAKHMLGLIVIAC